MKIKITVYFEFILAVFFINLEDIKFIVRQLLKVKKRYKISSAT